MTLMTLEKQLEPQHAAILAQRAVLDTAADLLAAARAANGTDGDAELTRIAQRQVPELELAHDVAVLGVREAEMALAAARAAARAEAYGPYTAAQRQDYTEVGKLLDKARAIRRRMVERRDQHEIRTGANVDGIAFGWLEHLDASMTTLKAESAL